MSDFGEDCEYLDGFDMARYVACKERILAHNSMLPTHFSLKIASAEYFELVLLSLYG